MVDPTKRISDILVYSFAGKVDMVKRSLLGPVDLNDTTPKRKDTALILAARKGFYPIVKMLIEAGANIDHQNVWGETALMCASYMDHTEIVKLLLLMGASKHLIDTDGFYAYDLARMNSECKNLLR